MKIKWIQDCEIEICEEATGETSIIEERKIGEIDEVEIVGYGTRFIDGKIQEDKNLPQFQFGDGSITTCISVDWFEIIEE